MARQTEQKGNGRSSGVRTGNFKSLTMSAADLGLCAGGVLSSRSVMLPELAALLNAAPAGADMTLLQQLVISEDALHKTSAANRLKTFSFLRRLYCLNPDLAIFREFSRLCRLFPADLAALASSLAFARESLLRACASFVLDTAIGKPLRRENFETWIREYAPGRYSETMYVSFSHNLYASFFQLGYLGEAAGKQRQRQRRDVRPAAVAYAAFLDWVTGMNGLSLLAGSFSKTLELGQDEHLRQLKACGQLGLMRVALAGGILQLDFSDWLRAGESRLTPPTTEQD